MDPVITKILEGIPYAGMGSVLERNALIGYVRNLIKDSKYTIEMILSMCESVGYSRQMAEDVFKELTGLSPKLIVNNNEYYNMPSYVPNMCIAWGISKSNKEKAFYIVPFEYGFAVMEKDEVNAPIPTVISATIPEAFEELKKVAKGIQTLDKIITKKLLEAEEVPTDANDVHQVNLPYAASPLQILKKNFKDKVLSVSEFERQASKLLASEEITVDEAEDLMAWKQDLIDEDETYGNDVLELDEQWKPVGAEAIDENEPDYENRVKEAFTQLSGMIEELDIFKDYAKRSGKDRLFDAYIQLAHEVADEWDIKPEALLGEMALENPKLVKRIEDQDVENFNQEVKNWTKSQEKFPWKGSSKKYAEKTSSNMINFDLGDTHVEVEDRTSGEVTEQDIKQAIEKENPQIWVNNTDGTHYIMDFSCNINGKKYNIGSTNIKGDYSLMQLWIERSPWDLDKKQSSKKNWEFYHRLNNPIKPWYTSTYKTDDYGDELNDDVTFSDILENPQDSYDLLGVSDSLIRERVFAEICKITGLPYEQIFNKWLGKKYASKKVKSNIKKKAEYGYYKDNDLLEQISKKLQDGYWYGDAYTYDDDYSMSWELKIHTPLGDLTIDKTPKLFEYLLDTISYPVADGHKGYNGLDVIIPNDIDIEWNYISELVDIDKNEEETEFFIDYEIVFDDEDKWYEKYASKKVTAENMTLDDIEEEDNKDQVQEEIEKIEETPTEDIFAESTPEDYLDKALQEDKVDTINDVVSKCIDKFSEKFKDFDKYQVKILSYNTKVLEDDKPIQEEMVQDKEIDANAILQVILQITNNAEEENIKKVLAVFSITNGQLHWTGTVRGENDQVVAFTEEGLDALFEVNEPSEEELEDII